MNLVSRRIPYHVSHDDCQTFCLCAVGYTVGYSTPVSVVSSCASSRIFAQKQPYPAHLIGDFPIPPRSCIHFVSFGPCVSFCCLLLFTWSRSGQKLEYKSYRTMYTDKNGHHHDLGHHHREQQPTAAAMSGGDTIRKKLSEYLAVSVLGTSGAIGGGGIATQGIAQGRYACGGRFPIEDSKTSSTTSRSTSSLLPKIQLTAEETNLSLPLSEEDAGRIKRALLQAGQSRASTADGSAESRLPWSARPDDDFKVVNGSAWNTQVVAPIVKKVTETRQKAPRTFAHACPCLVSISPLFAVVCILVSKPITILIFSACGVVLWCSIVVRILIFCWTRTYTYDLFLFTGESLGSGTCPCREWQLALPLK